MTFQETQRELDRIVKNEYPLIASDFINREIMLRVAYKMDYEAHEWRGINFPYMRLHNDFMELIALQYLTTSFYDLFSRIGEKVVVEFLNSYYLWELDERDKLSKELEENPFDLTEKDREDFDKYSQNRPNPCKEPLDIAGYLHMCRIAYDAAPKHVYPDFISDLHVVTAAKFNSCGLSKKDHTLKMKVGDKYPEFMYYHPEEMGFGGPFVRFEWEDDGWIMRYHAEPAWHHKNQKNKDIHRFLAMRRAGYPVVYLENNGV